MNKEKNLLTVTEAAAYLGVSTGTLRRWAQETKVDGVKIGSRGDWRFTRSELDGLIKSPRKNMPVKPFSQIRDLLNSHAQEITKMATREHLAVLGKDNTRSKVLYEYEKYHSQVVKELSNHLDPKELTSSIAIFKELGSAFGKQSLKEGITIQEASNGIIFLKQAIWKKMKTTGLLENFTCEEFYSLSQVIGTLTDTLSSQIAFTYHDVFAKMQEEYRQQKEKYQTLFNSIDEGFCVFELLYDTSGEAVDWIYLDVNPAFVKQTRYKDPIGKKISELQPDLNKKWFKIYGEVLKNGKPIRLVDEIPELHKWFEIFAFRVDGKDSKKISLLFNDITERKTIEEALKESEERYRLVVENTLDLISIFDTKGRFIYASPSYKDILGHKPTALIGQSLFGPPDLNDEEELKSIFQKILKGEKIRRFTTKGIDNKGNIHLFESSGSAIFDESKNPQMVVSVAHDITERVKQEKRKDDFIAMASHELKTPLTSTKLFTQVLERQFGKQMDKQAKKILSKMDNNLDKLDELIKSLLDVTKIQQGKLQVDLEKFIIKDLVVDIVEDLQPITEHTLILDWKTKLYVYADKERVRQVLVNLITNAIKYSPNADKVITGSRKKGQFIEIRVEDFGIGIPKEEQEKIFDRFYQVDSHNTYPGLGLGLYISSEIIKANGGRMWVESEVGTGSIFYFTLPIYQKC